MNTAQGYVTLNIPAFKVIGANVSNWNNTYVRVATSASSSSQCTLQPRLMSNDAPISDARIQIYYYYID